mmetsp:Transcript_33852/g.49369  ORF Transcript_33852/g.49369 Transcript_33852/m.49369 type:complete len:590 (+) Transcript_33852:154-1923(+)
MSNTRISANSAWTPSFEISHTADNKDDDEEVLSVNSVGASYGGEGSYQSVSSKPSTGMNLGVCYDLYSQTPWYHMNKRTMIATVLTVSLTTVSFVFLESRNVGSYGSPFVVQNAGSTQMKQSPMSSKEEVDQFRPHSRGLVRPHLSSSPMDGLLPGMESSSPEDEAAQDTHTDEAAQDTYIGETAQDSYNPDALQGEYSPFLVPELTQDSYIPPEMNMEAGVDLYFPSLSEEDINLLNEPLPSDMIPRFTGFADTWDPYEATYMDVPVYWHIPKTGGSTLKDMVADCHLKVVANEEGIADGHDQDMDLQLVDVDGRGHAKYLNVDTTTIEGINRAIQLGLVQSNVADLIVTPYLYESEYLFKNGGQDPREGDPRGRLFALFRHPVDRVISLFNYLKYADWEPTYDERNKDMTLKEYAQSDIIEDNWMTRRLAGLSDDDVITGQHLQVAMDAVRRKILVGLTHRMEESIERFERYYQWKYTVNPTIQETCRESLMSMGTNTNANRVIIPPFGSEDYNLVLEKNLFDLEIYKYAELLFQEQSAFVEGVPVGYRLEDATCSVCDEEEQLERESQMFPDEQSGELPSMNLRRV